MGELLVRNVSKNYGSVQAVKNLSFEVREGEVLGVLGPSGAGKTSTLKVIAGVIPMDGGEIRLDGRLISGVPTKQRDVAMVFETYALYPHMTVYDNLAFPLRAPGRNFGKSQIDERVLWALDLLHIPELRERMPGELSSGQRQRVSLGRAIVRKPSVFLMDEPISHLDAKLRHVMRAELKKILEDTLTTSTIYVTHDYTEVMALADRAVILDKGELQQLGTPDEIFDQPANQFVAHVVGSPPINFFECHLASAEDRLYFEANDDSFTVAVPAHLKESLSSRPSGDLTLGVRPIDIHFSSEQSEKHHIPAEVYIFEPLGAHGVLTVTVGQTRAQIKTTENVQSQMGDRVWLSFDVDRLHAFDAETTRNVLLP